MTRSQGFYGAAERVQIFLRMLENLARYEATQPGRKLLIWLSSGWPSFSGPEVELTAKEQATPVPLRGCAFYGTAGGSYHPVQH
jgi:hypothetical protein